MAKGNVYISNYPEKPPRWYWVNGLHDACIVGVEVFEFSFDYSNFIAEKQKYDRNMLSLRLNTSGALYDNAVKEIRLFNYKILSKEVSLENRKKIWWLSDRLTQDENHYILEIDMQDFDSDPEEFTFKIKFDRAEVDRRKIKER